MLISPLRKPAMRNFSLLSSRYCRSHLEQSFDVASAQNAHCLFSALRRAGRRFYSVASRRAYRISARRAAPKRPFATISWQAVLVITTGGRSWPPGYLRLFLLSP